MLTPQFANTTTFFYPVGNTPAVLLTQNLPPGKSADVLLLGCGDVRHILHTIHNDDRPLDITCCDIEGAIIARNILLLSLIIDDAHCTNISAYWDLYYHFRVDQISLRLLRVQAQKLCSLSASIQTWHKSKYGERIRFCDPTSLASVRKMWNFYGLERQGEELSLYGDRYEAKLCASKQHRVSLGAGMNLTGFRSAAPAHVLALEHLDTLDRHYWEHGTTELNQAKLSAATHLNPMFMSLNDAALLHYGTNPLVGFHLATAFVPLSESSPFFHPYTQQTPLTNVVEAAKDVFQEWVKSFRERVSITLRFFIGDALAFSYSLQYRHQNALGTGIRWFRDRSNFESFTLEKGDYAIGGNGPLTFTVIDTSNLIDHVGAINLLVATSPLLSDEVSATLHTEKLVRMDKSYKEVFESILCGDLSTISTLIGLVPLEFITNTSALSTGHEILIDAVINQVSKESAGSGQLFTRIAWKRPPILRDSSALRTIPRAIIFDPVDLAQVLYRVYLKMFEGENIAHLFSNITIMKIHKLSLPVYQRASFAAFLRIVKSQTQADWENTMRLLLAHIEADETVFTTRNYIQELYLWLHLLDLHSVETLKKSLNTSLRDLETGDLRDWKDPPPVVCVTLVVPRKHLSLFKDTSVKELGTPPVHCIVQAPPTARQQWQNIFGAIQIGFGQAIPSGKLYSESFEVAVNDDKCGWTGTSSLLASFYVPTWILLLEPRTATVTFGIQSTPQSTKSLIGKLGLELNVFQTTLADAEHVYISKTLPNRISGTLSRSVAERLITDQSDQVAGVEIATTASIDTNTSHIKSILGRANILSAEFQAILSGGCKVRIIPKTPFNVMIVLENGPIIMLDYPIPISESSTKTRISRKSFYIEVTARIASGADWFKMHSFMYPVLVDETSVVCWNMPYSKLCKLPIIDTSQHGRLSWLTTHTSLMFSKRERLLRSNPSLQAPDGERVRLEFKDSLFSLFMHYTGLQGRPAQVFGISCPESGGVHILLFASKLYLDPSNQNIILDAAAMPLYDALMPHIAAFLQVLTTNGDLCQIRATDAEMRLWKLVLPAWAERCRLWAHKKTCEYLSEMRVPLSVEKGERVFCSCGNGHLPSDFVVKVPKWELIAGHVVRVAISPSFSAPVNEEAQFSGMFMDKDCPRNPSGCKNCAKRETSDGQSLMSCKRCRQAKYCSQACQKADWGTHKIVCKQGL